MSTSRTSVTAGYSVTWLIFHQGPSREAPSSIIDGFFDIVLRHLIEGHDMDRPRNATPLPSPILSVFYLEGSESSSNLFPARIPISGCFPSFPDCFSENQHSLSLASHLRPKTEPMALLFPVFSQSMVLSLIFYVAREQTGVDIDRSTELGLLLKLSLDCWLHDPAPWKPGP